MGRHISAPPANITRPLEDKMKTRTKNRKVRIGEAPLVRAGLALHARAPSAAGRQCAPQTRLGLDGHIGSVV
jgi:hypothetical protein